MKLRINIVPFSTLCVAIGLVALGCTESETSKISPDHSSNVQVSAEGSTECPGCCCETTQEAVICDKCGQEKKPGACAECADGRCTDAAEKVTSGVPAGCCGKCAEELIASGKSAEAQAPNASTSENPVPQSDFAQDREVFHFLLSNKDKITRSVTELKNGVETLTESSDPAIVAKIQEHVAAMYHRVENGQPIRMRDPLFREVFQHADKIKMELENTDGGIRVRETSDEEYVVKLIQEHAKVVSGFAEYGFEEAQKNHAPPQR